MNDWKFYSKLAWLVLLYICGLLGGVIAFFLAPEWARFLIASAACLHGLRDKIDALGESVRSEVSQ